MDGWRLKRKGVRGKEMLSFDACLSAARIEICKSVLHSSPRNSTNTRPRFTKSIIPDGYVSSEQQSWNSQPTQRALVDEGCAKMGRKENIELRFVGGLLWFIYTSIYVGSA